MTTARKRRRWPLCCALALAAVTGGCMDLPPGGTRWTPSGGAWPGNSTAGAQDMDQNVRCRQSLGNPDCWRTAPQPNLSPSQGGAAPTQTQTQTSQQPTSLTPGTLPATISQ